MVKRNDREALQAILERAYPEEIIRNTHGQCPICMYGWGPGMVGQYTCQLRLIPITLDGDGCPYFRV